MTPAKLTIRKALCIPGLHVVGTAWERLPV